MSELNKQVLQYLPRELSGKRVLFLDNGNDQASVQALLAESLAKLVVLLHRPASNLTKIANSTLEYIESDLTELNINDQQFDLIFVNQSVLGSLDNDNVSGLAQKLLNHLAYDEQSGHGGCLLFRDSSFLNTTRTPINYIDLVESSITEKSSQKWGYTLIFVKSEDFKSSLVSFLFQKIKLDDFHGFKTLREFMDHKQYSRKGVLTYEKIFGDGFVSTGGPTTTSRFVEDYIKPKAGQRVLDVGCGIGGGDFFIAEKYGAEVFGMDLSSNMISIAWERADQHKGAKVHFEIGDITKQKFADESFDVIYSRDTILHIKDKEGLFALFKKWLKPGGKIFITDYCAGPKSNWSDEFKTYVEQRGYDLREVPAYGQIFTDLGFKNVQAVDVTDQFVECLNAELVKMEEIKETFVKEFSLQDFNYLVEGWKAKLVRTSTGNQRWGLFYCEK